MAELGAPGLLLISPWSPWPHSASAGYVDARTRRRASTGVAVAFLAAFIVYLLHATVDWMWESTAVTVLAPSAASPRIASASRLVRPSRLMRWALPALAAAAIIASVVQVPSLLSTTEIRRSQAADAAGQRGAALAWASDSRER